jgi:outer membrane protein assembly factor BamA
MFSPSLPMGRGIPSIYEITSTFKTQVGYCGSCNDLSEDLSSITHIGLFDHVEAEIREIVRCGRQNAVGIIFKFEVREYPPLETFRIFGSTVIGDEILNRVVSEYEKNGGGRVDLNTVSMMKNLIESYYQSRGMSYSYITHFDGMEGGHIVANVVEGRVRNARVVSVDDQGKPDDNERVQLNIVERSVRDTIKEGEVFNISDTRKALRNVFATSMFDTVHIVQRPLDSNNMRKQLIDVDVIVREKPINSREVELLWEVDPTENNV